MAQVDTELWESQGSALDLTTSLLVGPDQPQHLGRVSRLDLGPTQTRLGRPGGVGPS